MASRSLASFRRRLFTIVCVLSLLLCLATVALWVRSYWRFHYLSYVHDGPCYLQSLGGHLDLLSYDYSSTPHPPWSFTGFHFGSDISANHPALPAPHTFRRFLGFGFLRIDSSALQGRGLSIPHWFLALLFAILPALYLRAVIRSRKRRRVGLCPVCGYDLRATPDRCPECGRMNDEFPNQKSESMTNDQARNPN